MRIKQYVVEITFPDEDVMEENMLQDIIFNCPELENCLVNVYSKECDCDEENPDDSFFIKIPRTHKMFKIPCLFITPYNTEEISRPSDLIVCDVCNKEIDTELINCATFDGGKSIWGAYCEECRLKYQADLPIKEELP